MNFRKMCMQAAVLFLFSGSAWQQMPSDLQMKKLLPAQCKGKYDIAEYNAAKVKLDIEKSGKTPKNGIVWYAVPALSNIQRLPDQYPVDGQALEPLRVVMQQGEFEPASFELYVPEKEDRGALHANGFAPKIQISASDLKNENGDVLPASQIDLKVVKVWAQNGNAWYNYFGDISHKLVPELLLNDETLISVDEVNLENYLRVDYETGLRYIWISAPESIDPGFKHGREPVADAKTLQPVELIPGRFKQFFVTVETKPDTKPGLYQGVVRVDKYEEIPLRVRVLPFALPEPKTYYDRDRDFYTMLYCVPGMDQYMPFNGQDKEQSDKKTLNRFINQKKHNVVNALYLGLWRGYDNIDDVENSVNIAKKAGMKLDPLFEAFGCHAKNDVPGILASKRVAEIAKKEFTRMLGHHNLWAAGGEEPGYSGVVNARPTWKNVHELDMHVMCNGWDRRHFSGYNDEFRIAGGFANTRESDFMHRIQGRIGNYAGPHTGPENPDYMRRMHGLNLYKKDYDMMYNYGYQDGNWNEFHGDTYRAMNLVYTTKDSMIDTLAWEGIREGIDDIRYATCMLKLADEAVKSSNTDVVYAGRKAMQFMALLNENEADLAAARMEMIRHILTLRKMLYKGGSVK